MCIYKVKKQKCLKNSSKGVRDSTKRLKLGVSGIKDTAKTVKDLGMLCYIQVEYSVLFRWWLSFNHVKIIFKNI